MIEWTSSHEEGISGRGVLGSEVLESDAVVGYDCRWGCRFEMIVDLRLFARGSLEGVEETVVIYCSPR